MQNKIVDLTNEAINVNTQLFNRSVEFGVESAQQFVQNATDRTSELLKIKTFDDYLKTQENWNAQAIEQSKQLTRSVVDFGNEAYGSYINLWQKYSETVKPSVAVAAANGRAKK